MVLMAGIMSLMIPLLLLLASLLTQSINVFVVPFAPVRQSNLVPALGRPFGETVVGWWPSAAGAIKLRSHSFMKSAAVRLRLLGASLLRAWGRSSSSFWGLSGAMRRDAAAAETLVAAVDVEDEEEAVVELVEVELVEEWAERDLEDLVLLLGRWLVDWFMVSVMSGTEHT
jgi:hypothetical protein